MRNDERNGDKSNSPILQRLFKIDKQTKNGLHFYFRAHFEDI